MQSGGRPSYEQLAAEKAALWAENAELSGVVTELTDRVEQPLERIAELGRRLAADSHKSSRPTSADPPWNRTTAKKRSSRTRSARRLGEQPSTAHAEPPFDHSLSDLDVSSNNTCDTAPRLDGESSCFTGEGAVAPAAACAGVRDLELTTRSFSGHDRCTVDSGRVVFASGCACRCGSDDGHHVRT